MRIARPAFGLRGDFKRLRQQRVARQHGDAFAEDLVVGRLAAAEIVVVHRRQIVVDERVGVDALDGAGQRQGVGFACRRRPRRPPGTSAGRIRLPPAKSE